MKTAEEILKSKLNPSIAIINNPDYTFNKVIEAMEEYADQFKQLHEPAIITEYKSRSERLHKHNVTQPLLKLRCANCGVDEIITNNYCNCCGAKQLSFSNGA